MPAQGDLFILVTMDLVDDVFGFQGRAKAHIAAQGLDPGWSTTV